jgi:excisionase family DNA binding protein
MARDFYTPSEVAKILRVPLRRILERLAAGEIEAEKDPRSGRWRVPKNP